MNNPQESANGPYEISQSARLKEIGIKTRELATKAGGSLYVIEAVFGTDYVTVPMKDLDLSQTPGLLRQFIQIAGKENPDGDLVIGIEDRATGERAIRLIHKNSAEIYSGWTIDIHIPLEHCESGPRIQVKYYEHPTPRPSESQEAEEAIMRLNHETTDIPLREERLALVEGLLDLADQAFGLALQNTTNKLRSEMTGGPNASASIH